MDLIAKWRTGASQYGMASLQLYLLSYGAPILPVSDHIVKNSRISSLGSPRGSRRATVVDHCAAR
ncbi:hypothetical protein B586_11075 [Mycobacterium haemophilum DSM 44634]|nr:hypothetical protein B586_11075 [Mycobacterium haemophilum DSM 44634]